MYYLYNNIYIKYIGDVMKKIFIDIREPYEYRIEHIPNSINIPRDLLELVPEKYLNKENMYILYCELGISSLKLSNDLNKKGYYTKSLNGGYSNYKNNKY